MATLTRPATAMDGSIPGQKSSTGSLLNLSGNAQVFVAAVAEDLVPFDSPTFTGSPSATTATPGDSSQRIATTAFVTNALSGVGGNVSNSGTPVATQLAQWVTATSIQGINASTLGYAPLASPTFTGLPAAPTPATGDATTQIATTAYVKNNLASYLPLVGGTLTGGLTLNFANANIVLRKTASGQSATINGYTGANARWSIALGSGTPESTGNLGSDFAISRYDDAGAFIDVPITISRATGTVTIQTPTILGTANATSPAPGDSSTRIATTAWVKSEFRAPIRQAFTTSGTYFPTAGCKWFEAEMVGGGAGGANGNATVGVNGGDTTFGGFTAQGGNGNGVGGAFTGSFAPGDIGIPGGNSGNSGNVADNNVNGGGSPGGDSMLGRGGAAFYSANGGNAVGFGGGGGGGGRNSAAPAATGHGGGGGGYIRILRAPPAASYVYTIGAGGGGAGTSGSGLAGGAGTAGVIIVTEYFQ